MPITNKAHREKIRQSQKANSAFTFSGSVKLLTNIYIIYPHRVFKEVILTGNLKISYHI